MSRTLSVPSMILFAVTATSCGSGPRALVVGEDACRYCRMAIDDVRFGGMVLTARGRLETFDSIECLTAFVTSLPPTAAPRKIWVGDFERAGRWLDATDAHFVYNGQFHSPMGRSLAAFDASRPATALQATYGGEVLTWTVVQSVIAQQHIAPASAP